MSNLALSLSFLSLTPFTLILPGPDLDRLHPAASHQPNRGQSHRRRVTHVQHLNNMRTGEVVLKSLLPGGIHA